MRIIVAAALCFLIAFGVGLLLPFDRKKRDVPAENDPGFDCRNTRTLFSFFLCRLKSSDTLFCKIATALLRSSIARLAASSFCWLSDAFFEISYWRKSNRDPPGALQILDKFGNTGLRAIKVLNRSIQ
jgi:hypothetical protein